VTRADDLTVWRATFVTTPWRRARDRYWRLRPIAARRVSTHRAVIL
jgi:hypothetical protein